MKGAGKAASDTAEEARRSASEAMGGGAGKAAGDIQQSVSEGMGGIGKAASETIGAFPVTKGPKSFPEVAGGVQRTVAAEGPTDALELAERSIGPGREGIETEVGRQAVEESGVGAGNAPFEPPPFIAPGGQGSADLPSAGDQASIGDPHSTATAVADVFGGVGHAVVGAVNTAFGDVGDTFSGVADAIHQQMM